MYYTYYSYETNKGIDGSGYIGYRKLRIKNCTPETEPYWGSQTSPKNKYFKDNPHKNKIILGKFKTKKEAVEHEAYLHRLWQVDTNEHFANQAIQSPNFYSEAHKTDTLLLDWVNDSLGIIERQITTCDLRRKYNLSVSLLSLVKLGKRRSCSGWRLLGSSLSDAELAEWVLENKRGKNNGKYDHTTRNWINANLGIIEWQITNHELAKKYPNINKDALSAITRGGIIIQHKGWTLLNNKLLCTNLSSKKYSPNKNHHAYDHTVRDWINSKSGIIELQITSGDLVEKYPDTYIYGFSRVVKGTSKSHKGWRLYCGT